MNANFILMAIVLALPISIVLMLLIELYDDFDDEV